MKRYLIILIALVAISLACSNNYIAIVTPTIQPIIETEAPATLTPTAEMATYTVQAETVYVRNGVGNTVGTLHKGDIVQCEIKGNVCIMANGNTVFAGCLDADTGLGCESR